VEALRLFLLGEPRFERGGQPAELSSAKATALVAHLALTGVSHGREPLLALLWPESPGDAARKNLRNTLWAIRKALGDDAILTADDRLALARTAWADTQAFELALGGLALGRPAIHPASVEQSNTLIALYRGPLLDGLSLADAPEFELWLATERERFGQMALRLLTAAIEAARATQDWQSTLNLARRALALDDLQEPMHRAAMEAYARLDQRAEALRICPRITCPFWSKLRA